MDRSKGYQFGEALVAAEHGARMYALIGDLFPLCRSITGTGVRHTLHTIQRFIPLTVHEVPTGTQVFDWSVPKEWNIRDAYVKDSRGEKVIDFRRSNLHLVGYSTPIHRRMSLAELRPHLFSSPEHPDWIPYRNSFYNESWGFCISDRQLQALPDDTYEVCIDSSLEPGSLTYAECYLAGESRDEVLIATHICHPSLCNDNLSGIAVAVYLAAHVSQWSSRRLSYRFLFLPSTIGSITWLARNEAAVSRIRHGLVLACLGDTGQMTYKRSRRGNAMVDRAVEHVLRRSPDPYEILDFSPWGYDERQFCSPGFDLPVGRLTRTPNGCFPEYHTSADNLDLVRPHALADSLQKALGILHLLDRNDVFLNLNPKCEPQLGRRGLYAGVGMTGRLKELEFALLWVLNRSDGRDSLLDIAERARLDFPVVRQAAEALQAAGLLRHCPSPVSTEP